VTHLDFLNTNYPIRRTPEEKKAFREYIIGGFPGAKSEKTNDGKNENVIIGDPLTAKVVCTAHYDTPARSIFPNIMIPRCLPLFWLYQFVPVIFILAVSLAIAYACYAAFSLERNHQLLIFLAVYYIIYFTMFRGKKNPKNFNDNTSGVAAVLTMAEALTEEQKKDVAFILFDNEEKGKKGSKAYFADHKKDMENKLLINFDCVGNGENFVFVVMKDAENKAEYSLLRDCFAPVGSFSAQFFPKKGSESNSDYKIFPCGIGCMACKKAKGGLLYTPSIHTPRDTAANNENIDYIADCMKRFFASLSAEGNT